MLIDDALAMPWATATGKQYWKIPFDVLVETQKKRELVKELTAAAAEPHPERPDL